MCTKDSVSTASMNYTNTNVSSCAAATLVVVTGTASLGTAGVCLLPRACCQAQDWKSVTSAPLHRQIIHSNCAKDGKFVSTAE